jgi:hypothetical protein
MPTPRLPDSDLIHALNLVEEYGSEHLAEKAGCGIPSATLRHRAHKARLAGLKPTFRKEAPRIHTRQRLGKMHLVIPDAQVKDGVPIQHMEWIGNFITEKKPDVIINIGDFWDFESLSKYDKGKLPFEGRRYVKDVNSGRKAMEKLLKPIDDYNRTVKVKYKPRKVFTLGNHEIRLSRLVDDNPEYEGKFSLDELGIKEYGWEQYDYLKAVKIDGIKYAHYFTTGSKGYPASSARAMLMNEQSSCTMGHNQKFDVAIHPKTLYTGLFCGTCYLHDERYLGHQGNSQKRGIVVKHEVEDGVYDMMVVSLKYLEKAYS